MTKFDALEEVHAELKLKELLWNAIDEWDNLLADWTQVKYAADNSLKLILLFFRESNTC